MKDGCERGEEQGKDDRHGGENSGREKQACARGEKAEGASHRIHLCGALWQTHQIMDCTKSRKLTVTGGAAYWRHKYEEGAASLPGRKKSRATGSCFQMTMFAHVCV